MFVIILIGHHKLSSDNKIYDILTMIKGLVIYFIKNKKKNRNYEKVDDVPLKQFVQFFLFGKND